MSVLVTGGTGFVGSAVVAKLLERGEQVGVLARGSSNQNNLKGLPIEIRIGDLRDKQSLTAALDGYQALYHVAADYRLWTRNSNELYDSNVSGTKNLMEAALECGTERIVYTSSVATLGVRSDGTATNEDTPVCLEDMVGHYKRSKYLAEKVVDQFVRERNLPAVIVNPSTPIGPRDIKPTPTGRIIVDAASGKIPAYVDTGLNVAHVDDVATGHLLAFDHGQIGRRYILGGEDMTLQRILSIVAELCDRKPPKFKLPRRIVYPIAWFSQAWASFTNGAEPRATIDGLKMSRKKMYFSSDRAQQELGYEWRPGKQAIEDAVSWFRDQAII